MSEAFLRCPAAALVSGGGDGGVGNVHSEVGPVVEDSAAMKGFDVVAALLAGAGAGDAAGALLQTSFLPEIRKLWGLKNCSFTQNTNCMRECRHTYKQSRNMVLPDKEGACSGSGRTPPPLPAPRGRCRGATEVAEGSVVEDGWWWWGSGEPAT